MPNRRELLTGPFNKVIPPVEPDEDASIISNEISPLHKLLQEEVPRRTALKVIGALGATVAVAATTSGNVLGETPGSGSEPTDEHVSSPESELPGNWADIVPIVQDKYMADSNEAPRNLYKTTETLVLNDYETHIGSPDGVPKGSIVEYTQEKPPEDRRYLWEPINVLYIPDPDGNLIKPPDNFVKTGYIASVDTKGTADPGDDSIWSIALEEDDIEKLPDELKDIYEKPLILEPSTTHYDVSNLKSHMSNTRELADDRDLINGLWKREGSEDTVLEAWQNATYYSAFYKDEEIFAPSVFRVEREDEIEIISRFHEDFEGGNSQSDLFIITRYTKDPETDEWDVEIGFADDSVFKHAYGEEAEIIASQIASIQGEGTIELVQEIATLDQAKVFLPSLHEFAGQIQKPEDIENVTVEYWRIGDAYQAAIQSEENENISSDWLYIGSKGEGTEWVKLPDAEALEQAIVPYAKAYGVQFEDVMSRLEARHTQLSSDQIIIELFDPVTHVSLLDGLVEDGEYKPSKDLRLLVELSGKNLGFFVDHSKPVEQNGVRNILDNSTILVPGVFSHNWLSTAPDIPIDEGRRMTPDRYIGIADMYDMGIRSGNFILSGNEFAQWLADSNMSTEEFQDLMLDQIDAMITSFPDVDAWYIGNGLLQYYDGTRFINNDAIRQITGEDSIDLDFIKDMLRRAQEAADTVEEQTGKRPKIGLSESVQLTQLVESQYVLDNSVTGPKADYVYETVLELAQEGLVDRVGFEFQFTNIPSEQEIVDAINRYDGIVEVEVAGLNVPDGEYYSAISALLKSNAIGINVQGINNEGAWDSSGKFGYLYSNNEPNTNYYEVRRAYSDYLFNS